ncbi:sugar phosphate isomerase/epimerase family protein [Chitinophaga japonensis]|nr:sugar phosphate isomerase/epimerase [Chitinophaga japonensis]
MQTRRSFLQQAALVAAGLAIHPIGLSSCSEKKSMIPRKLGIQLYTLRDELAKDVRSTIAKVAEAGYEQVETFYSYEGPASNFWGLSTQEFKALLQQHNLTTPSGHYQLNDYLTKGNGNDSALKAQLEIAAAAGQSYFTVPIPPLYLWDKYPVPVDDYKFIATQLNRAGELAKASNLKVAYHNHFWEFRKLPDGQSTAYDILLNETDPALVAFELDLFWAVKGGQNPDDLFNKAKGRFPMWHVKDMDKTATASVPDTVGVRIQDIESEIKFAEVGSGSIDFKDIFAHAETAGVQYLFVEQDRITIDPFESIRKSAAYVKGTLMKA